MPLYKYVTIERIDVLRDGLIRFTQPAAFNDPFELFPYFESIAPEKNIEEYIGNHVWDESEIDRMLEESWLKEQKNYPNANIPFSLVKNFMKSGFEQQNPVMMEILRNFMAMKTPQFRELAISTIMKSMNDSFGILCLSESPDNILMWSHYAANNTGFVIEFDERHSFFDQRKTENEIRKHIKKVRYSKERPKITLFDPNLSNEENIEKWISDFFWVKNSDWSYEKEWRMFQTFRDWDGVIKKAVLPIYLLPIPADCIKSIILGCRTPLSDKERLLNLLTSEPRLSHVLVKEALIDEIEYKLNINEIGI